MIEVVDPGPQATVQDTAGRRAARRFGVPFGGAADPWSARLANRLVGNDDGAALVEVLAGGSFAFAVPAIIAVSGGLGASVDGVELPRHAARRVPAGARLRLAAGAGLRGYVAVAGGIDVPAVLGSRATDVRTGFGGLDGRALRAGDRLPVRPSPTGAPRRRAGPEPAGPFRIVPGPQGTTEALAALTRTSWSVGDAVDRTGVRLAGDRVDAGGEVKSQGVLPGAIQLPPDGAPIVMLADGPVTGGYRVPACVIGADVGRVAQLRPGDSVELVEVSVDEAREAWLRNESELAAIETLDAPDDEPGWAGAHG